VYDNIRRFLRYALSGGVAELLVMLTGPLVGFAVPLLPAQILWVNLLTHGLPGVAMGAEPGSPQSMSRPPRARDESVLGAGLGSMVLVLGTAIAVCVLAAARWAGGAPWQTVAFLVLGFAQLWIALAVRAPRRAGQPGNPWLYAAVGLSAALMVAGVGLAPLRDLLGTHAVPLSTVLATIVVAALPGAGLSLWTARRHRSDQVKPADQLPA
jgi:Ca2+-transporting ATPase